MRSLSVPDAAPGLYLVRSASPATYLLDLRSPGKPLVARVRAPGSPHLGGEGVWHPLVRLQSGGTRDDPEDAVDDVVRVGRRHRYVGRGGGAWWVQRVATQIDGPLRPDEVLARLPADRSQLVCLTAWRDDGTVTEVELGHVADRGGHAAHLAAHLLSSPGCAGVDVADPLLLSLARSRLTVVVGGYQAVLGSWRAGTLPIVGARVGDLKATGRPVVDPSLDAVARWAITHVAGAER